MDSFRWFLRLQSGAFQDFSDSISRIDAGTSGSINDSEYRWLRDLPPEELAYEESARPVDPCNLPEDINDPRLRDKPKKAQVASYPSGERRGKSTAELEELREEYYDDIPF